MQPSCGKYCLILQALTRNIQSMRSLQLHLRLFVAVSILLTAPLVPHHHHGAAVCVAAERCRADSQKPGGCPENSGSDGEDCGACTLHMLRPVPLSAPRSPHLPLQLCLGFQAISLPEVPVFDVFTTPSAAYGPGIALRKYGIKIQRGPPCLCFLCGARL